MEGKGSNSIDVPCDQDAEEIGTNPSEPEVQTIEGGGTNNAEGPEDPKAKQLGNNERRQIEAKRHRGTKGHNLKNQGKIREETKKEGQKKERMLQER